MEVAFYFLLFGVALGLEWNAPTRQDMENTRKFCKVETEISDDELNRLLEDVFPDSPGGYRYVKCVCEKIWIWEDDSGFSDAKISVMLEGSDDVVKEIKECNDKNRSSDDMEWFTDTVNCLRDGDHSEDLKNIIKDIRGDPIEKR